MTNNPNFSYYVLNHKTLYVIAGFHSSMDAEQFVNSQKHGQYIVVTRGTLASMKPEFSADHNGKLRLADNNQQQCLHCQQTINLDDLELESTWQQVQCHECGSWEDRKK